jgi:hypothetical protein
MRLRIVETASGNAIFIDKLPAVVGRDVSADVRLDDPDLPPYACMIGKNGDEGLTVWSLRQELPVYINGQAAMRAPVQSGDRLTIGKREFVVQCEAI